MSLTWISLVCPFLPSDACVNVLSLPPRAETSTECSFVPAATLPNAITSYSCADVQYSALTGVLWVGVGPAVSLTFPSSPLSLTDCVSLQMSSSGSPATRKLNLSHDNKFWFWYPVSASVFQYQKWQQTEMHSLLLLKASLVGAGGVLFALSVMFIAHCTTEASHKILCCHGDRPSLCLKGPSRSWETESPFFACEKMSPIPYFTLISTLFSWEQQPGFIYWSFSLPFRNIKS